MWNLPRTGIEPVSPAWQDGFLSTEPPGSPVWGLLLPLCLMDTDVLPSFLHVLKYILNSHHTGFSIPARLKSSLRLPCVLNSLCPSLVAFCGKSLLHAPAFSRFSCSPPLLSRSRYRSPSSTPHTQFIAKIFSLPFLILRTPCQDLYHTPAILFPAPHSFLTYLSSQTWVALCAHPHFLPSLDFPKPRPPGSCP